MPTGQSLPLKTPTAFPNRSGLIWLAIILCFASIFRFHELVSHAYMLDECWSMEIATGRGSLHQHLPFDQVITPGPAFYSLNDAPPWWHIWTHMQVTHPPLYEIFLRWWADLFGDSDFSGRLFSVVASLLAIALLFDTVRLQAVRLQAGLAPAIWAAVIMSLAAPQIEHARLARSYTLLTAIALITVNLVVRIQIFGLTRRRWILLTAAIWATLMTHYFCVGAVLGLLVYALVFVPAHRRTMFLAFAVAGAIFAVAWSPWMWQQRHLFATDDQSTLFLSIDASHHVANTFIRLARAPFQELCNPASSELDPASVIEMIAGTALLAATLLPGLGRRNPFLMLWLLWYAGAVIIVALLDLTRGTNHLLYIRYTILAGPAIYALIPSLFAAMNRWRGSMHIASALAALGCLLVLPDLYNHNDVDPRIFARGLRPQPGPGDLIVFAGNPADAPKCEIELLMLARYLRPLNCSLAILTHPAGPDMLAFVGQGHRIFLDTQDNDPQIWFPGAETINAQTQHGLGNLFTLRLRDANAR